MAAESIFEIYRFGEKSGTYESFTTLLYPFTDECVVKGLIDIDRKMFKELVGYLTERGVKQIRYEHKGKRKMIELGDK